MAKKQPAPRVPDVDLPTESGENFYSPSAPPEQVAEEEIAEAQTVSQLPVINDLIAKRTEQVEFWRDVRRIKLGNGVKTDAQVLAAQMIADEFEKELKAYKSKLKSVTQEESVA